MLLMIMGFYIFDFIPIVWKELRRKVNPVRRVSLWIFGILIAGLTTLIPSVYYQFMIVLGNDVSWLLSFVTITATFTNLITLILLWLIMHYRWKG